MLRSMTGFGKGSATGADGTSFVVELSAVNRKQLEMRFSMPQEFSQWEAEARKAISSQVSRGSLWIRVNVSQTAGGLADLNRERLESLIRLCDEYAPADRKGMVDVASLLSLPGVFSGADNRDAEADFPVLTDALQQALAGFNAMRECEGEALQRELSGRLVQLRTRLAEIEPQTAGLADAAKAKILTRLADEKLPVDLNDERFLREVLYYADRSDVTEEITRLKSHFDQFDRFLTGENESAGRSMDFLIQEMFREITTLGNKAGSSGVSPHVVAFKAELEKLREQIQNVE